ncbi:4107_t:CDS:2 [Diversispora eburnea]|uniref:Autophagy-related protein 14 n=1 Tax=Diversispora eburnea TaxID=1213867 RepID=A0A9N8YRY1_9GLOM|nr:4107_t:CDS:2 [Diversispora eburnea]
MECQICHNYQYQFCCANCLRERLRVYNDELKQITQVKQRNVEKSNKFLTGSLRKYQMCLAEKQNKDQKLNKLGIEISKKKEEIVRNRQEIDILRRNLQTRRQILQESFTYFKKFKFDQKPLIIRDTENTKEKWRHVHQVLTHSRKVLIGELLSLFDLKEVPDPSSSSPTNNEDDCEYMIAGMTLPKKTDYFICPDEKIKIDETNAAVGHVIHMVGLIAHYLGVKLPFILVSKGSKSYAKDSMPGIFIGKKPLSLDKHNSEVFTVGMAMLNYDIAYLCHTQGVDIPFHKVTNTLRNLYHCCRAPNLGRSGHLTAMNRIFDRSFGLDFEQLLRLMFRRSGNDIKDGILRNNIPGATIPDYFEEDFEDDNGNDSENWVICDNLDR